MVPYGIVPQGKTVGMADFDASLSQLAGIASLRFQPPLSRIGLRERYVVKHCWISTVSGVLIICALPIHLSSQTTQAAQPGGPFARIAIFSALVGHAVEWEAGYIRHLVWHRQAKVAWAWYSYSVWATPDRQRSIIYATFGHSATDLNNPVSPAEDERDTQINILPHAHFIGNSIYEFLPALSLGNGVPTPALRAEYTTVEVKPGAGASFEDALAAEQPKLRGETLWYRLVAGGSTPGDDRDTQPPAEYVGERYARALIRFDGCSWGMAAGVSISRGIFR